MIKGVLKIALFEKTNPEWKDLSETKGFLAPLGM